MDAARDWTDEQLAKLEKRIAREYSKAAREMRAKQRKHLEQYAAELEMREKALDGTKEAMEAHRRWLSSQAAHNGWMQAMVDELARSAHSANEKAMQALNDSMPLIYAENANMAAYGIDRAIGADTFFSLVNEDAVRQLMLAGEENAPILQEVNRAKDIRWNRQKFTSAITQGILQGESIPQIVKRTESVYGMNRTAAVRAARTATTNVENMGRMSAFERAQALGIDMEIEWDATLDGRTRESHRAVDGERIQLGETFSNGLRWPGDPEGPGAEVWNCRCRADGRVVGFDGERGDWVNERGMRWTRLPEGMTYREWKAAKPVPRDAAMQQESRVVSVSSLEGTKSTPSPQRPLTAFNRTGFLTSDEFRDYKRELEAASGMEQIWLPPDEYAMVMSEINTNITKEDMKHAIVTKRIGNNAYTFVNRGFNEYIIVDKELLR